MRGRAQRKAGAAATPRLGPTDQLSKRDTTDCRTATVAVNGPQLVYRKNDLPPVTGLQRSMIEIGMREGWFPKPIKLTPGGKAVGWLADEIAAWQEERRRARDGEGGGS